MFTVAVGGTLFAVVFYYNTCLHKLKWVVRSHAEVHRPLSVKETVSSCCFSPLLDDTAISFAFEKTHFFYAAMHMLPPADIDYYPISINLSM